MNDTKQRSPLVMVAGAILGVWALLGLFARDGTSTWYRLGEWAYLRVVFVDVEVPTAMVLALLLAGLVVGVVALVRADGPAARAGAIVSAILVVCVLATRESYASPSSYKPLLVPVGALVLFLVGTPRPSAAERERDGAGRVLSAGAAVPAPIGSRFGAYLLDGVLVVLTLGIGWLIWSIVLWGQGTSPGKKIVGLHLIDVRTGQRATTGRMAFRELVGKGLLGVITFGITSIASAFMIMFGRQRVGVWDLVAGTLVVADTPIGAPAPVQPPPAVSDRMGFAPPTVAPVHAVLAEPAWSPPPVPLLATPVAPAAPMGLAASVTPTAGVDATLVNRVIGGTAWHVVFDDGRRVRVGEITTFGRDPRPDDRYPGAGAVAVDDPQRSMSKTHFVVGIEHDGIWVEDCGSVNGTELVDAQGRTLRVSGRSRFDETWQILAGDRTFAVRRT